jgi:hypothetical protein
MSVKCILCIHRFQNCYNKNVDIQFSAAQRVSGLTFLGYPQELKHYIKTVKIALVTTSIKSTNLYIVIFILIYIHSAVHINQPCIKRPFILCDHILMFP